MPAGEETRCTPTDEDGRYWARIRQRSFLIEILAERVQIGVFQGEHLVGGHGMGVKVAIGTLAYAPRHMHVKAEGDRNRWWHLYVSGGVHT